MATFIAALGLLETTSASRRLGAVDGSWWVVARGYDLLCQLHVIESCRFCVGCVKVRSCTEHPLHLIKACYAIIESLTHHVDTTLIASRGHCSNRMESRRHLHEQQRPSRILEASRISCTRGSPADRSQPCAGHPGSQPNRHDRGRRTHRDPDAGEPIIRPLLRHDARRSRICRSPCGKTAIRQTGLAPANGIERSPSVPSRT